jgi:hypothetical protein
MKCIVHGVHPPRPRRELRALSPEENFRGPLDTCCESEPARLPGDPPGGEPESRTSQKRSLRRRPRAARPPERRITIRGQNPPHGVGLHEGQRHPRIKAALRGFLLGSAWAVGCAESPAAPPHEAIMTIPYQPPEGYVYTLEIPPEPRNRGETGIAPTSAFIWVNGYWTRVRDRWVWVPGRFVLPPQQHLAWEAGYWVALRYGYVRIPGRWR